MTLRQGRFVRIGGGRVELVDDFGNRWASERVGIRDGAWGYDQEGTARLPRPWVYNEDQSTVLVRGDVVLIQFLNGNHRQPVVMGGLRRVGASDAFLDTTFDDGAEQVRMQQRVLDPSTGTPRGAVRVQAGPDDGTTVVTVLAADEETVKAEITISPKGVQVRSNENTLGAVLPGAAEPLIKGDTYLSDEAAASIQEALIFAAAGAFFGIPFDQIQSRNLKLQTAVAGTGEPYLSTVSKTE